jgi:MFS family permease
VLLPFAAGYYLSYLFRTINALIAADLTAELHCSAADLGLLTSVYFLVLAAAQLPLGALLDRYGPATIQGALLLFASAGSLVFALADSLFGLIVGRALLALGVALALMAGFKAIVMWFPPERVALANGWLVMLGALGAVTATGPAELIVHAMGWRGLFVVLAGLSAITGLVIVSAVPEYPSDRPKQSPEQRASLWSVYGDRRFWRIAPLSATGIGASWSLQGLWAAPWLRDVDNLDRSGVVVHLTVMALAVCLGALLLGAISGRLRRIGMKSEWVLAATLMASMAAQALLLIGWPIPSLILWSVIAAAGAGTVLSFAILGEYYPREYSGRANAALNLLHLGCAFALQSATGLIIAQWPEASGAHPPEAHAFALALALALQMVAFAWFVASPLRLLLPEFARSLRGFLDAAGTRPAIPIVPYKRLCLARAQHARLLRKQVADWRFAAVASAILTLGLAGALSTAISRPAVAIHVVEAFGTPEVASASDAGTPIDDQIANQTAPTTGWPSKKAKYARAGFSAGTPMFRMSSQVAK